jgi:hypothetical protein
MAARRLSHRGTTGDEPVLVPARFSLRHTAPVGKRQPMPNLTAMHKPKPYKCSICGAEVPDLPMPVLKHQMSHVTRRPFALDRREPSSPEPMTATEPSD